MASPALPIATRPRPCFSRSSGFAPSPELDEWVQAHLLNKESPLFNRDHLHLASAHIGYLWAYSLAKSKGRDLLGQAWHPNFRGHTWPRYRAEQQLEGWFGDVPDFVIMLDANFCEHADDASFCALLEHELYHCDVVRDEWGCIQYSERTGDVTYRIRPHDVEEFEGVVRRYGAEAAGPATHQFVQVASRPPTIAPAQLRACCGTCK